jgi:uncharacterized metal-binding protein YceD (DUF177 family)
MKNQVSENTPELSRPLHVEKISAGGVEEAILANEEERKKLSERFGLLSLPMLEAQLAVAHARGGMFAVKGHMSADVVQQCVVTLEPLPAHIEQDIDILYADPEFLEPGESPPHALDVDDEETEAIVNGIIDLGELVSQNLGIALDPYPRKPGLAFVEAEYGEAPEAMPNPFAKLAELKDKKPKN